MMEISRVICIICIAFVAIGIFLNLLFILHRIILINRATKIVRKKCDEYVKYACAYSASRNKASWRNVSYIMGGTDALEGTLPHMAFVAIIYESKLIASCGGTLISEYFVMTAAHCVKDTKKNQVLVILGGLKIGMQQQDGTLYELNEIYINPNFDSKHVGTYVYDIALLKLDKKVQFGWKIRPICLNTDFESISIANVTTSGWGVDEDENLVEQLQVVETFIDDSVRSKCVLKYGADIVYLMICAGHLTQPKSPCHGDSGGPLQIPLKSECPNTYEQIGITSHSDGSCSRKDRETMLVMYTKIQIMILWIVNVVWPDSME